MRNELPTWLKVASLIGGLFMVADSLWNHRFDVAFPWAIIVLGSIIDLL